MIPLLSVTAYNLEGLAQQIDAAALACSISAPILDKATAYFYHALFMANAKERVTNFLSFHANLIISEIILNYYKAVSTIIGDPSIDRDYQSRYRRFGISHALWSDAERLRELRNTYDIAHYTPDLEALKNINTHQRVAHITAQETIKAYTHWLESVGAQATNP